MKNKTNQILLGGFLASLAAYILLFSFYFSDSPLLDCSALDIALLLFFPSVPLFLLQLLLCRLARGWRRLIPSLVFLVLFGLVFLKLVGWDPLSLGFVLLWFTPSALGAFLAWAVWTVRQTADPAAEGRRTDQILLIGAVLSFLLYGVIFAAFLQYGGSSSAAIQLVILARQCHAWLTLTFHAVPFFCLQLLLCRRVRRWLAALPAGAVTAAAAMCVRGFCTASGWDTLGWALLLAGCAAPAAGCILAWAVYGLCRLRRRSCPEL